MKPLPKSIREAAALLGAREAPTDKIRAAAETLLTEGLTRGVGESMSSITRSVGALVEVVFAQAHDQSDKDLAVRRAQSRFAAHRQAKEKS